MKAATDRPAERAVASVEPVVLFDGSRDRPWGPYIGVESEEHYARRQRPCGDATRLSPDEQRRVLVDAAALGVHVTALDWNLDPASVERLIEQFAREAEAAAAASAAATASVRLVKPRAPYRRWSAFHAAKSRHEREARA